MNALVIVHAELSKEGELSSKIAEEAKKFLGNGDQVYFLASIYDEHSLDEFNYPIIRLSKPHKSIMPTNCDIEAQFLKAKELIMRDDVKTAFICGREYDVCVSSFYCLASGTELSGIADNAYETCRKQLRWSREKLGRIVCQKIDAFVKEDLTDKLLWS